MKNTDPFTDDHSIYNVFYNSFNFSGNQEDMQHKFSQKLKEPEQLPIATGPMLNFDKPLSVSIVSTTLPLNATADINTRRNVFAMSNKEKKSVPENENAISSRNVSTALFPTVAESATIIGSEKNDNLNSSKSKPSISTVVSPTELKYSSSSTTSSLKSENPYSKLDSHGLSYSNTSSVSIILFLFIRNLIFFTKDYFL